MKIYCISLSYYLYCSLIMAKQILFLVILWISACPLYSQITEPISFVHIGLNEGLSQSTVFDITQDKRGNMWFATYDGLNKYDGYSFTVYQHDEKKANSIGSDIIRTIKTDSQNRIWVGTAEGLSLYDGDKDIFLNFEYKRDGKNMLVSEIVEVNEELLLVIIGDELLSFSTKTQKFSTNTQLNPDLFTITPTTICRQGDNIYVGSFEGLFSYSISQNTLKTIVPEAMKGKQILPILQQSSTQLWVGTEGDGLFLINPQSNEVIRHYTRTDKNNHHISSDYVRSLAMDAQGRLWVGTINSLNIYHKESNTFITYESDPLRDGSLSQTSVRSIYMDSQGGMWSGTFFGGLNYYHPLKKRFRNIQFIPGKNSLNDNVIGCIVEDDQKNLWIGTNSGGLNYYNLKTNTFTHYTKENGLESNDIKAIFVDNKRNAVYIGSHAGGLSILNRASGHIETFKKLAAPTIAAQSVYAIIPVGNDEYLLGTLDGVVRFNPQQKAFTPLTTEKDGTPFKSKRITTIRQDSKKRLWFGSEEGLIIYKQESNELQSIQLLPTESALNRRFINCIHESHDSFFYIGTRNGMFRFDEATGEIKQYTTANGLPNNVVYGILEDAYGKLWISTDKGLSSYHPKTEHIRNFTNNDGLQSNQFSQAYYQAADGQVYFGGVNGITTFHPEQLIDNPYTPPVTITQLSLFNKPVRPGDDNNLLEKDISETRTITLAAKQSMFSLEFVVSNYIAGDHNTFAYMLEGYDKEWYTTTTQRIVSYSNLPHGTYRFLVKAANNDGKWNDIPTELEIVILPVWYKTGWAFLLFAIAFILITTFIFRYFWIRKSMKAQIQLERVDKERQKEINEMKLRFFINISHELRTPLTLILAPLQELLDRVNDRWMRQQLEHMQRNTTRLLHLVNQLMDYRRAELGVFSLKVKYNAIHQVIEKNFHFYEKLALHKKITYDFYSEIENQLILCDPNYLELIVNNLLSNAFKYTHEGQSITVTIKKEKDNLMLQVKDTGTGIPVDKQGKIFERFYQVDKEHLGSGIGLSLVQRLVDLHHGNISLESQEGLGSTFSIYLPTTEESYHPDEKAGETEEESQQTAYTTNDQEMYIVDAEPTKEAEKVSEKCDPEKEIILIVEDNVEIQQYLSDELKRTYHILKAGNGEEALEIMKEQKVDLILTDVMMPIMDGLQLCKRVKSNLRFCHIPIIVLSAKADLKEQLEGLEVGADDYIPKPFSLSLLTMKIKNLFRTRHHAIQHYSNSLEIEPEKIALNPLDEELLRKAVEIVEKHLDDVDFSTEVFAGEMCMSRSNLHLKIKALTGEPANEFIRKIRYNHACKLLNEKRYTVAEISTMVGFSSPSYFATSFKKYFGCMPSEYIKNKGTQQN